MYFHKYAGRLAVAGALLTGLTNGTSVAWLLLAYIAFGTGLGLVNAPITNIAVSGMPRDQAGVAAAVASTSRQIGQTLGVAVVGSAVTSALAGPFGTASRPPATSAGGS